MFIKVLVTYPLPHNPAHQPFTIKQQIFIVLKQTAFKNIVGKGQKLETTIFFLFTFFSIIPKADIIFLATLEP